MLQLSSSRTIRSLRVLQSRRFTAPTYPTIRRWHAQFHISIHYNRAIGCLFWSSYAVLGLQFPYLHVMDPIESALDNGNPQLPEDPLAWQCHPDSNRHN